jgi:hypothetical protein
LEFAKLFPGRPDLVAQLEAMQRSWVPRNVHNVQNVHSERSQSANVLASRLAERWGARVRA